jgi:hypothetical protein
MVTVESWSVLLALDHSGSGSGTGEEDDDDDDEGR